MLRTDRVRARGPLRFIEPRFVPWVYTFTRLASPAFLRFSEGISKVESSGIEHLIRAYQQFYRREARVLIAFRHPSVHDPPVMVHLFCRLLPAAARRRGERLGGRGHAHFLYGRGVLNWARGGAAFLIPRIGGIPVMNRRNDTRSTRTIRRFLSHGRFPICLAPEGQVSYHNYRLGSTEAGTARLAVWCLEDLDQEGRKEEILIVPTACRYHYNREPRKNLDSIIARIVQSTGLHPGDGICHYDRLITLTDGILQRMETFYSRFYTMEKSTSPRSTPKELRQRIERVCHAALRVPERFMRLEAGPDLLSRVFTVRQRGWDFLFRSDLSQKGDISAVDRIMMDRIADEVYLHLRHNELVDVLLYLRPDYIGPQASYDRLIEYALSLYDVVNRLMGGDIGSRYSPHGKHVQIRIGEAIRVREVLPRFPGNRRNRIGKLMETVVSRLQQMSIEGS